MFKLSNETKVAILAIAALALGFWGFQFLKGINVLTASKTFYVKYENVDQLRPSSPVFIKGFQVGMVKDMYIDKTDDKTVIAVININRGIDIPKDAVATIIGLSLMGGKAVEIVINKPCENDCAESGDYLKGDSKSFLQTVVGDPGQIDAYTDRLRAGLSINFDSLARTHPEGLASSVVALDNSLKNIELVTARLASLLAASNESFVATAKNAAGLTGSLRNSEKDIAAALSDLAALSKQLKEAGLDQTSKKAASAIDSVTLSLSTLRNTLSTTTGTLSRVDTLAQNLLQGKGLAGKTLSDEELYNNLVSTSRHLHLLLQDLRLHPGRYNTVKVKLWGKKSRYTNPIEDPAYQLLVDSLERDYSRKAKN